MSVEVSVDAAKKDLEGLIENLPPGDALGDEEMNMLPGMKFL